MGPAAGSDWIMSTQRLNRLDSERAPPRRTYARLNHLYTAHAAGSDAQTHNATTGAVRRRALAWRERGFAD